MDGPAARGLGEGLTAPHSKENSMFQNLTQVSELTGFIKGGEFLD
jgi:hypothetical protein